MMANNQQSDPENLGCIHVISGDGKGKTTSSLGLALRAAGHGFRILIIQFMKKGWDYGELKAVELLPNVQIVQYGTPDFVNKEQPLPIDYQEAKDALQCFVVELKSKRWDFIILDEINVAIDYKLISEENVLTELRTKPSNIEIILTGRNASQAVIELADYYTIIQSIKHPYQKEIMARKGVEF